MKILYLNPHETKYEKIRNGYFFLGLSSFSLSVWCIVHFVKKVPRLVQMIVTIYRVQAFQVPIVNPRWPPKIQDGRNDFFNFFFTFEHQTARISRASSRSPCFLYIIEPILCVIFSEHH